MTLPELRLIKRITSAQYKRITSAQYKRAEFLNPDAIEMTEGGWLICFCGRMVMVLKENGQTALEYPMREPA